ncbi:MAG TPA: uroporphyrinogen decarboxylase family protein [Ruminiclostridium sp.]
MTNREREHATLSFKKPECRGSVEETFFPWTLTVESFAKEGLPETITSKILDIVNDSNSNEDALEKYLNVAWGEGILNFEKYFGFDSVRRISFTLPFRRFDEKIIEETAEFVIKIDRTGRQIKHYKETGHEEEYKQVITCEEDWKKLKDHGDRELAEHFTDEKIEKAYGSLRQGHQKGDYSIRLNLEGFFWTARELLGIEPHMFAFYDYPEMLHDINEYILKVYLEKLTKVLDIIPADVVYIMEDLSGKTGPMISPKLFDEFVGSYYKRLIPALKSKGVGHVFVDTDGDFKKLIPNFIAAGVEGFLPMDVNAGMDIVAVRKEYPNLKFIGAFNKLFIAQGKEAIDKEFERILPVIRQGGYIPGSDHQVAPSTSIEDYKYYISKLKETMKEAGKDL